jgi:hypothetical protein
MSRAAIKPLLAILLLMAAHPLAHGQAGSIGGVVGKTDKSLSGGTEPPEAPSRAKRERPVDRENADQPAGVSGRWRWSANCTLGSYQGEFVLTQTSRGNFSGGFGQAFAGGTGPVADGHISGASVSFTQTSVSHYWKGQLSGNRMSGTISGGSVHAANCSWEASRK